MDFVVFNFHDVILLMTAMLCGFFALLLIATNPPNNISNYFLAAFLIAHAFIPLHELILWGADFKLQVRTHAPGIYFIGGFAYYLDAVLLYFYVKSLVFRDFHLRPKDYLHLLPLALFGVFMLLAFYRFPAATRLEWINSEAFVYSFGYIGMDFFCKFLRVGYCVAGFLLIYKYKGILKNTHSNIEKVDILWLKILVLGFLVVTAMEAFLALSKAIGFAAGYDFQAPHPSGNVIEYIGLSGYYALFVLVCTLVFTSMRYFSNFEAVRQKDSSNSGREPAKKSAQEKLLNPEYAEKIDSIMRSQKTYLNPDLTLDMLAENLSIPAKDLSMIINRHFNLNFYEFINGYRIEEVQKRLLDPANKDKTITDIYLEVGFNSKSVFNTFFKKLVGKTPSEYRQNPQKVAMAAK
ncbi:helix-turn-helix domain-containing protein [Cellvibrio sp. QJXJ]|uniref:helix-turn-helix domain-containing protein n=1 Tax=Cellvibrio sp. QJXJ TaxID=2964606 RepID=UPI0021C33CF0|nr:helix-turn-helix domain-containing protein [Cellvibrio sp. QJXJ]UUA72011.1 helix-turn-helix domain-containing protein [Cellvibrio sp. QJXJ]